MLGIRHVIWKRCVLPSVQKIFATTFFPCYQVVKMSSNSTSVKTSIQSTVNKEEVKKFQEMAQEWWNPNALIAMNALRVPFVRDGILQVCSQQCREGVKPLKGFTILDIGCGGGILAEPLARLGARVTGLDPGEENIKVAQYHSSLDPELSNNLEYICNTVEDHIKDGKKYDAVVCSEVIEHVDNVPYFVKCCTDLVADNGSVFFTTINRTAFSNIYAIFLAERVFHFIPRGTHEWNKFIKPEDLKLMLQTYSCKTISVRGMFFNPFIKKFAWISYQGGFYALHAVKEVIHSSSNVQK